jgi:hypothetical protein
MITPRTRSLFEQPLAIPAVVNAPECLICGKVFADKRREAYQDHIDRHFPDRYPCGGACGIKDCEWIGSSTHDISYHKSMMNPKHECAACGKKFGAKGLLDKHVESAHVRQHQVVGFAAKLGYDVGPLGGAAPWMSGAVKAEDDEKELPLDVQLALDAAKAVIGARKY